MGYSYRNPQNRTKAAALLLELKGRLADVSGITVEPVTNTAATSEAYWQLSKASGVHVYQQDGGWHADLAFKDLPAGVPTIIGTLTPVATRADAVEHIVGMMLVCAQRDNVPAPDPITGLRYFRFDDHEVPVHPGLLAEYVEKAKMLKTDPADVFSDLADIRVEIAGDGPVTQEAWDAAPFQSRYDACKVSCIAMALGIRQITFDPEAAHDLDGAFASPAMH